MGYFPDPSGNGPVGNWDNPNLAERDSSGRETWAGMNARYDRQDAYARNEAAKYRGGSGYRSGSSGEGGGFFGTVGAIVAVLAFGYFWGAVILESSWPFLKQWGPTIAMWMVGFGVVLYIIRKLWPLFLVAGLAYAAYLWFAPAAPVASTVQPVAQTALAKKPLARTTPKQTRTNPNR